MEEVIDIGQSTLEPITLDLNKSDETPSVNFGSGIELLMNDKKKTTSVANLDLGELDTLEGEIIREAEQLVRSGVKELLVISQDTSAYGVDLKYRTDFWDGRPLKSDMHALA